MRRERVNFSRRRLLVEQIVFVVPVLGCGMKVNGMCHNTYSSVSHLSLFSDSQSITMSHIMTHDNMINERKKKCFIKGIFLLVSFYLYMFVNHNE